MMRPNNICWVWSDTTEQYIHATQDPLHWTHREHRHVSYMWPKFGELWPAVQSWYYNCFRDGAVIVVVKRRLQKYNIKVLIHAGITAKYSVRQYYAGKLVIENFIENFIHQQTGSRIEKND